MQRTFFALFCLATICSVAQASKYCDLYIFSYFTTVNTEDSGSASESEVLASISKAQPTASQADLSFVGLQNNIDHISYSGTNCTFEVKFWSKDNFKGNHTRYTGSGTSGTIQLSSEVGHDLSSYEFSY